MKTRQVNTVDNFHGTLVPDPYRWLENSDDPEVQQWVVDQDQLKQRFFQGVDSVPAFKKRLTELWDFRRTSLPSKVGSWYFFQENSGLQNQPVLYRQQALSGDREVVLDPNEWSSDGTVALSNFSVDPGARYLAYTVSTQGSDRQEIHIRDLERRENLPEVIEWCRFTNMAWLNDLGFYYSRYPQPGTVAKEDENNYNQVYWHTIGTSQTEDILVFDRPDAKELSFSPILTQDQAYLLLHVFYGTSSHNGFYYRKLGEQASFVRLFEPGEASYRFLGNQGSMFYFFTDLDAPQGRIISLDVDNPGRDNWVEIVAEQDDVMAQIRYMQGQFVVSFMHNAYSVLRLFDEQGELVQELPLPALGSVEGLAGKQDQDELFIAFSSYLQPSSNFRYDFGSKELTPFGSQELNFNPKEYETSQVFYPSKDGTQVSMFLTHKRGLELDGNNPTLLYGYGGFNIPMTPTFSASRILWLEQGGIFAVANLRGGSEYGEAWHQAGMLGNKQNVFDDFQAAAQYLVTEGYTNPSKLAIEGRSNGGLLVSACMVQRPDLYGAVICGVPVTDMLRYHKFTVGRYWIPEYGRPEDAEHFPFLYAYSPLHNVKPASYPATFVVTAAGDDRVVPGHAYKFTAALQEAQQGNAPILLRVDTKSGHGHGKPISKIIDEHADVYGFLKKVLAF